MSVPAAVEAAAKEAEAVLDRMAAQAQAQAPEQRPPEAIEAALGMQQQQAAPAADDVWKQRYDTLKGKYDAEVRELRESLAARDMQIIELREAIARLDERTRMAVEQQPTASDPELEPFTEKDREELGEFDAVIGRKITHAINNFAQRISAALAQVDARLRQLESTGAALSERSQVLQVQNLVQRLDQLVPVWRRINQMPEFMTWLNAVDPYSGRPRRELLTTAWMAGDADRVAEFFRGFDAEARISETARGQMQAPPPPVPPAPAYNVGAFAAPRTAPAAAPASTPTRPSLTDSDIRTLFDPRRKMPREQETALLRRILGNQQG